MKFEEFIKSEGFNEGFTGGDKSHYLLILTKYSTDLKKNLKQYLVWTKKDLQTYEPKAYGSTMDAAIATFNKVREDREEEEYIESLGVIDCDKLYASKVCDTLAKAKADIMKISPEVKKALESGSKLGESFGDNHPALKPFFEWFKKKGMESLAYIDINTYKGRFGFEVSASGIIGSKVKYERLLDAIKKGPKNVGGKNYEYAASYMHDTYFYYSSATKLFEVRFPVVEVIKECLTEAKKVYYLLLKRRTNDQLGKSFYKFMVWTLADLKSYTNRAKGASMERAVNAYNNSANAYLEVIGEVSGVTEPAESGDKTDIAAAKSEIISQCPAVKSMVQNVRESLTEGEFISVKDLEAKAKKLNPQKEAKLKAALAKVDAARAKVEKFMKIYDSSDEAQRLERVKLGGELASAMTAYLELV